MNIPIFHVDAFTSRLFGGSSAAVCPLKSWIAEATLQSIAAENALSETAFLVPSDDGYDIRWMTPTREVDLCGHATLASGWVVFHHLQPERKTVTFASKSGPLKVARADDMLVLDFPSRDPKPCEAPPALVEGLGRAPREVLGSRDYLAVYDSEAEVRALRPDMSRLATLDRPGVIVTAPGERSDFVSRFFAPGAGIPEDPVTGSAHCTLIPYWSRRLGRQKLRALQVSARGGELLCMPRGDRVAIAGRVVPYSQGLIRLVN